MADKLNYFVPASLEGQTIEKRGFFNQPYSKTLGLLDDATIDNEKAKVLYVQEPDGQLRFINGMKTLLATDTRGNKIRISLEQIDGKARGTLIKTRDLIFETINENKLTNEDGELIAVITGQDLVDKNIYKNADSMRKHAPQLIRKMRRQGVDIYADGEQFTDDITTGLFSYCHTRTDKKSGEKTFIFALNKKIPINALFSMYVPTPNFIHDLTGTNAYLLLKYISTIAKINYTDIGRNEEFTLSFKKIIKKLGLKDPTGKKPKEKILDPLLEAIEEIQSCISQGEANGRKGFKIEAVYNPKAKTKTIIEKGCIKVKMSNEITTLYIDKYDYEETHRENVRIKVDAMKETKKKGSKKKTKKPAQTTIEKGNDETLFEQFNFD